MSELLSARHLKTLTTFFEASESCILLRYGPDHSIQYASRGFLSQVPGKTSPVGESVNSFVADPDGRDCSLLSASSPELPISFTAKLRGNGRTYLCHLHDDDGSYLLIGELLTLNDSETLERMSLLTNELATLTLELRRRNTDLEQANETIRELTRVDPLTNLANRRRFAEALDTAMAVARRHSQPLSLISIDLDRFKSINDTFGHDVGDEVLRDFAALLKDSCRIGDLPVRLGGEEFLLMTPNTVVDEAYMLAERLRMKVASAELHGRSVRITASFGVTQLLPQDNYFAFLKRADMALYEAKSGGRNKTVVRMTGDPHH